MKGDPITHYLPIVLSAWEARTPNDCTVVVSDAGILEAITMRCRDCRWCAKLSAVVDAWTCTADTPVCHITAADREAFGCIHFERG